MKNRNCTVTLKLSPKGIEELLESINNNEEFRKNILGFDYSYNEAVEGCLNTFLSWNEELEKQFIEGYSNPIESGTYEYNEIYGHLLQ